MILHQNPTIYIGGLRIDEPITSLTNLFFCAVCLFSFFKTTSESNHVANNLYRWFFLFTGISTLVSAIIGHAFLYYFGFPAKIYGWVFALIGVAFAQFASVYHTRDVIGELTFKTLFIFNTMEIILAFILTFVVFSFAIVEVHTAYGLLLNVTILEYVYYKKTKSALSKNMIIGVGIAVLAVLCHLFKVAFSVWFNHLDLSHIFMALSMFVMYKGVNKKKRMLEKENSADVEIEKLAANVTI